MIIKSIRVAKLRIPLVKPFITALRRTEHVEDVVIEIETNSGLIGYGSAAATHAITGDSQNSIIFAISEVITPRLIGKSIYEMHELQNIIHSSMVNNTSAKAAVDMALYDLVAKSLNLPLYKLLGGSGEDIQTVTTISVKNVTEMVADAVDFESRGFNSLKIKVGLDAKDDLIRLQEIRKALKPSTQLLADANQGWTPKEAIYLINKIENLDLNIAMIEQPVKSLDFDGLKLVRENSRLPVYADESMFSVKDASKLIVGGYADGVNIKLMKCAGIYQANTIYGIATTHNIPCMAGCMLESAIGVGAMASFVSGKQNIKYIDLDPLILIKESPITGGVSINGATISFSQEAGLGITNIDNLNYITEIN